MKRNLDFPVRYVDGNLVFGKDGTVTAYYRVEGFAYDFIEQGDKLIPFQRQMAFLVNNQYDLHFVVMPFPTDADGILSETLDEMELGDYAIKEQGKTFINQVRNVLTSNRRTSEVSEYLLYLGIQLNPSRNRHKEGNHGTNIIGALKEYFQGLNAAVNRAAGLEPYDILQDEIDMWKEQSDSLIRILAGAYSSSIRPLATGETVYLIEKSFSASTSNNDVDIRRDFTAGYKVNGNGPNGFVQEAIRPKQNAFIDLQDANIEEVGPKCLKLSRFACGETYELYSQHLVAHSMDEENHFPNFEWIYHLQSSLPYPVQVSIRAYHQSNSLITKRLSNARLEFEDQKEEARKAGTTVDLSVSGSERGAIEMENYFKKSGQPAYSCSIVFRINAGNEAELSVRAMKLRDELSKFGIKAVAPYGEQISMMLETILGSRKMNDDYKIEVAPGVLAGMMFGATTNIGDGRGFFIGYTEKMNRPVFIKPDLAAKAFAGLDNVEDSISVLVAGATGKGKSFFMNLYTYLSLLTGSQALVIDPKGDRLGWSNGLPYIDGEYISVWTLGAETEDAGCLDPFRTSVSLEEGKDVTMDILSYLCDIRIHDGEYSLLSEAVEEAAASPDPCIGEAIGHLKRMHENRPASMSDDRYRCLENLKATLETLKRNHLAKLLFGESRQSYKVLRVDKPLQVMMVQNLNLPDRQTKHLRISHKISEAILISITAFTKQYMFRQDRSMHKIILQDESASVDRSPIGSELMDFIVRKGRYYNTTLLKGSQNATDHDKDVANMGMKFSFGLRTVEEAEKMLGFLNLPNTRQNIETLRNLRKGICLFQDIYGRTAIIKINPVFNDLLKAFDSSTASEEERKRELNRKSQFENRTHEEMAQPAISH